jgi:hypothetical protein
MQRRFVSRWVLATFDGWVGGFYLAVALVIAAVVLRTNRITSPAW